jgi:ankyrin repeat protein
MKKVSISCFSGILLAPAFMSGAVQESDLCRAALKGDLLRVKCLLSSHQSSVNSCDRGGFSPLMYAVWNRHTPVAELLLEKNASVNAASHDGHTPLMIACANGHESIVPKLLTLKADIHASNKHGWTPLNRAAWNGHYSLAKILLSAQADSNQIDSAGNKARALAEEKGHTDIVSLLDEHEQALFYAELAGLHGEQALIRILGALWQ